MFSPIRTLTASFLVSLLLVGCATPAQKATYQYIDETTIDEIRFDRAHISDVIDFLVQAIRAGQEPLPPVKHTPNIVFFADPSTDGPADDDIFGENVGAIPPHPPTPEEARATITMTLKNVTHREVLDRVCQEAKVSWRVDPEGLIVVESLE